MTVRPMEPWITTYTGKQFYPMAPRPEMICIEDIAHHLALQVRWSGATREAYSIAQHSFHVAQLVAPEHRLWALLHDASEAYLLDIAKPLKVTPTFAQYRGVEAQLQKLIFYVYGLAGEMPAPVHEADRLMLVAEAHDLLMHPPIWCAGAPRAPFPITAWSPAKSEAVFLNRFWELTGVPTRIGVPRV